MDDGDLAQLISTLVVSPSNDILSQISSFLHQVSNEDLNPLISKFFQSLLTLEHWSWEILSRDTREWFNDEEEYVQLFLNLSLFNTKLILSDNEIKIKEALLLPANSDILDGIFEQIAKRNNEKDRYLSILILWFDTVALFTHEHIELTSLSIISYLNKRMISDIFMTNQFQIYLKQLKDPCPFITTKQFFYIKTCLFVISAYFYSKPDNYLYNGQQILEYVAEDYVNIILIHSRTLPSWSNELLGCITHLIGLITACQWWIGIDHRSLSMFAIPTITFDDYVRLIVDLLCHRLFHKQIHPQWSNNQTILVDHLLELLRYLIRFPNVRYFLRRQKKLLGTFLLFDHVKNDRILLITYLLQSELLSEKEMKQFNIAKKINKVIFDYVQQAWTNPSKKHQKIPMEDFLQGRFRRILAFCYPLFSSKGFFALSTNDILKDAIVNSNQLTFLMELSAYYPIIYEILWALSFDIRIQEQLRVNSLFLNQLNNIKTNESMQKIIHGIQWNLNLQDKQHKINRINTKIYDIMISYSQKEKIICTQLYNDLHANGYRVWVDFNETHENLIDAAIQAITQSRTILLCMSEQYKRSSYCRIQAQYASQRQLKILPIIIEKWYKPDGWLLFLIGSLLSIDLTKYEYPHAVKLLLNELKNPDVAVLDSLVVRQAPQNTTNLSLSTLRSTDIRQWTKIDVQQWLKDNHLSHLAELLTDLHGIDLIYLSKLISTNSPQENLLLFQEDSIKRTGRNVSLIEIARLHHLIELQTQVPVKAKTWNSKYCCRMM